MRAIVLDHFGGLDSLIIKEIPEPDTIVLGDNARCWRKTNITVRARF